MGTTFAKITDLFQEGQVLVLSRDNERIPLWIQKLNPFELEEVRTDGRVARARMIMAIREIGTPEYAVFQAGLGEIGEDALIEQLVAAKETEWLATAVRNTRSDPEWRDRAEVIEQSADLTGRSEDDPELKVMLKLGEEYAAHINELVADMRAEEKHLLLGAPLDTLRKRYEEAYLDDRGLTAFTVEYQRSEVYFAVRECLALETTEPEDQAAGRWDHSNCNSHGARLLPSKVAAGALPMQVWTDIRQAISDLNIPLDIARFSAAPESSSASSEQPSVPEAESTPSTPEVMPAEPVGISS